jgi:hypothetical protein
MKQDGYWASKHEKANTFAEHFIKVFTPNARKVGSKEQMAVFGRRESTQSQMTEITKH